MTHAFMYGTATFEGIRAYWNAEQGKLYGLKIREHVERIRQSCRILLMEDVPSVDELTAADRRDRRAATTSARTPTSGRRSTSGRWRSASGSTTSRTSCTIIAVPFGNYIDTDSGVRVMTSTWRRNADEALPARGKIVGGYVNMAFQKSEAELNGFDEAVVLTADGHVNEASAANMFVVRDGVALTPPVNDDLLEGVTRKAIMELLANEKIPARDPLDRPVRAVRRRRDVPVRHRRPDLAGRRDRPPARRVGRGRPDRAARADRYFDVVRGRLPEYRHWLTEIAPRLSSASRRARVARLGARRRAVHEMHQPGACRASEGPIGRVRAPVVHGMLHSDENRATPG